MRDHNSSEFNSFRSVSQDLHQVSEKWIDFSKAYTLIVLEVSGKYAEKASASPKEVLLMPESLAREIKKKQPGVEILGMGRLLGDQALEEIELTPKMEYLLKEVKQVAQRNGI